MAFMSVQRSQVSNLVHDGVGILVWKKNGIEEEYDIEHFYDKLIWCK